MWTREQVAGTIDHAALKPNLTDADIVAACRLGKNCGVASVCVRPSDVVLAAEQLAGFGVLVSTVIGFPHGSNRPDVKALEAKLAIADGAAELDMVMNVGKFFSGDYDLVLRDIRAVVAEAKAAGDVIVKVIIESCYLSPAHIAKACQIALAGGADFVKTSTGFADGPATPEAVAIMVQAVGDTMGVKASGGIRSYEAACGYLDQGCTRLGLSSTEEILQAAPVK
ncbi:MAG: deoxyribose-phosphate aldolase [Phycisphaerae bacterium]|nr:deoxyribose-phosphate aldolase [Phycisphaerae bacterium]